MNWTILETIRISRRYVNQISIKCHTHPRIRHLKCSFCNYHVFGDHIIAYTPSGPSHSPGFVTITLRDLSITIPLSTRCHVPCFYYWYVNEGRKGESLRDTSKTNRLSEENFLWGTVTINLESIGGKKRHYVCCF